MLKASILEIWNAILNKERMMDMHSVFPQHVIKKTCLNDMKVVYKLEHVEYVHGLPICRTKTEFTYRNGASVALVS